MVIFRLGHPWWCLLSSVSLLAVASAQSDGVAQPFLENHCVQCHGTEKKKGKVTLHDIGLDFSDTGTADRWIGVLDMLTSEDMPPEDEKQPEAAERTRMIDWINEKLDEADQGEAYREKLLAPEYGNWVDHEKLFSGEIDTQPYSPSRLWRYSPEIFDRKGFGEARSPYTYITPEKGIRDYAAISTADRSTVQMILINAEQFLEEREGKGDFKIFGDDEPMPTDEILVRTVEQEFRRIIGRGPTKAEQAKYLAFLKKNIELGGKLEGLKTMIKAIFLNPEAVYRMEFGLGGIDEYGRRHLSPEEMVYTLTYALTDELPERSKPIWDAYQNGNLNNKEDAARVVRQMLDEQLGAGPWSNRKVPRIMRFFEQFFGFDRAGDVFKDDERKRLEAIPQWNPVLLVNDARMLIEHILKKDKDVISELLTTNDYFVAHPGDNGYAREFYEQQINEVLDPGYVEAQVDLRRQQLDKAPPRRDKDPDEREKQIADVRERAESKVQKFKMALEAGINPHPEFPFSNRSHGIGDLIYIAPYNLPESNRKQPQKWNWPIEQPFELPAEQRAGLLTHPAWLAAWSVNDGNDPIHRGIWVYEKLLAGKLQDVPPDVDAKVPVDPHQTLRERLGLLREERCWNCHHKINPLGETFEMFDDWGRYRTEHFFAEDGKIVTRRDATFDRMLKDGKLTSRKVDATGAIAGTGEPGVDGDVENAVEMIHRLGKSQRVRQSFIRHLFRYFMGRNEILSDSKTLIDAEKAYVDGDGSFKDLVISLLSSDSFLYRR